MVVFRIKYRVTDDILIRIYIPRLRPCTAFEGYAGKSFPELNARYLSCYATYDGGRGPV